jgi:hypothetical protein
MDNPKMHFLAASSPLKLWEKFDQQQASKWVTSFKANLSPIEIPFFPSKNDEVKALIDHEIERARERARHLKAHQYSLGAR